jgi:dolichyl-phosphate-mannose-protein mannosyltransferase
MLNSSKYGYALTALLFLVILLTAVFLRAVVINSKHTYLQDEGSQLILITAHLPLYDFVMYDGHEPTGKWVPARAWKRLFEIEGPFSYWDIVKHGSATDYHPPLNYWLLRNWYKLTGLSHLSGGWLSLIWVGLTCATLFFIATDVFNDNSDRLAVVFIWSVSPALVVIPAQARMYDLISLCSVFLVWRVIKTVQNSSSMKISDGILIIFPSLTGALTHYHFAFVVSGCFLFAALRLFFVDRKKMIIAQACICVGYFGSVALNPYFHHSIRGGLEKSSGFTVFEGISRVTYVLRSVFDFFIDKPTIRYFFNNADIYYIAAGVIFAGFLIFGFIIVRKNKSREKSESENDLLVKRNNILFFVIWVGGWLSLIYILCISPPQAMGTRYLSIAWPFFAFVPVFYFRMFGKTKSLLLGLFCAALLVSGLTTAYGKYQKGTDIKNIEIEKDVYDIILMDSVARTHMPAVVYLLPENTPMFAAYQDFLIENPEKWIDRLEGKVFYISKNYFGGNSPQKTITILEMIKKRRNVIKMAPAGPGMTILEIEKQ